MKTTLGQRETRLLAYRHMRGLGTVQAGDLTGPLLITAKQERELAHFLEETGWTNAPDLVGTSSRCGVEYSGVASR